MGGSFSFTGKMFAAALGLWGIGKFAEKIAESSRERPTSMYLDGLPQGLQYDMFQRAASSDWTGFNVLLDRHGCPRDGDMRTTLWHHFRRFI